jgi:hypothetical protein
MNRFVSEDLLGILMSDVADHGFMLGFRYRGRQVLDDGFSSGHIIFEVESRRPSARSDIQSRDFDVLAGMPNSPITLSHITRYSSCLRPRLSTSGQRMWLALESIRQHAYMNCSMCSRFSKSSRENASYGVRRDLQ